MGRWADFPLPDGSYSDASRPWSQQDVVNLLPTFAEQSGTRSRAKYVPVPGLKPFAVIGNGPHRGARDVEGRAFVVSGNMLYRVSATGVAIQCGAIPGTGLVSMTHNQVDGGNQVVIGTRDNSYVYDTRTDTLTATGVGLSSVDFLGQYVLGIEPQRRFWRYSALADALSWNTLDAESAESSPDRIVGGIAANNEWLVFGERTIEPWVNSPTASTAFQRNTGAIIERGCINANTLKRLDNSVFFVDNNFIPCRLQGYTPVPIAPKPIIEALAASDPRKLSAFTWEDKGYVVYYIKAADGQTFGYDVTSRRWHRRESFGKERWRVSTLFKWNGAWYAGDESNGNLYQLAWGYMFEGEGTDADAEHGIPEALPPDPLCRSLRTGVIHADGNRVQVHGFKLLANTGLPPSVPVDFPEQPDPPTITGAAPDGTTGFEYDDYSYTVTEGDAAVVSVAVRTGSLPPGLVLSNAGVLAGTPTAAGTYAYGLRARDANSLFDDLADTVTIRNPILATRVTGGGSTGHQLRLRGDWSGSWETPAAINGKTLRLLRGNDGRILSYGDSGNPAYTADFGVNWTASTGDGMGGSGGDRWGAVSGDVCMVAGGSNGVKLSADNFASFSTLAETGSLAISHLDSGRWLSMKEGVLRYCDSDAGTGWSDGASLVDYVNTGGCARYSDGGRAWFGMKYLATSKPALVSTVDGASLSTEVLPAFATATTVTCIHKHGDILVIGTDSGEIAHKDDNGWHLADDALGCHAFDVTHNGVEFLMIGGAGTTDSIAAIKSSADGNAWTTRVSAEVVSGDAWRAIIA